MVRRIFVFGGLAGLIVGIPLSIAASAFADEMISSGPLVGYLIMLAALSLVFVAVKRQRDAAQGGVIKFFPALGMGLAISRSIVEAHGGTIAFERNRERGTTFRVVVPFEGLAAQLSVLAPLRARQTLA